MSKIQLKKELSSMTREQLAEMILEAYTARKEIKEYFDYFLNPDERKLLERYQRGVARELSRTKRGGYSKARISHIKRLVNDFESFQPSLSARIDLMLFIFSFAVDAAERLWFTAPLERGVEWFMLRAVDLAEENEDTPRVVGVIDTILNSGARGNRGFRADLSASLQNRLSEIKIIRK